MKKLKIIVATITTFSLLALYNISFAAPPSSASTTTGGINPFTYSPSGDGIDSTAVVKYTGPIKSVLYGISIVLAVISVSVVGFKYMIGSTQEKAEYKKLAIPVVLGMLIIVFLFKIISVLADFASEI